MGRNPTDRGKKGTKKSLVADGGGGPLGAVIAEANVVEQELLRETIGAVVVERPDPAEAEQHLCLDKGYDNPDGREEAAGAGYVPHIRRIGVRLIENLEMLTQALAAFPRGVRLMLQAFIADPAEAGIFYIRHPDAEFGRITSLTLKSSPCVVGDGRSTLRALVHAHPRAGLMPQLYLPRLQARQDNVPPAGEVVPLVFTGNHCKGSVFENGADAITPALTQAVDAFARGIADFHFGRIDVRYSSEAELRMGQGFTVIEVNGAGSEATHIWDKDCTLRHAYASQFAHYAAAWEIGRIMRARGRQPTRFAAMARAWLNQRRLMASYPQSD